MKKLLVLAMSLGLVLAMPMAVGAAEFDPSPDMPYMPGDGDGEEDPDMPYNGEDGEEDPDMPYDANKSPKTGDTSRAGAAAAAVVIAGGVAYFAGRKLKRV